MSNKAHNWKIAESNLKETTYKCENCKEEFYVDEQDFNSSQTPPRKGCIQEQANG